MNVLNLVKPVAHKGVQFLAKNSSTVLVATAIAGVVTTIIFTAKATPKAKEILDEYKENLEDAKTEADPEIMKATVKELRIRLIKRLGVTLVPVIVSAVLTIGCIVGSHVIDLRKKAALMAACNVVESRLQEYVTQTKEVVGEEKAQEIKQKVSQSLAERENTIMANPEHIYHTGNGEDLFYDEWSGRWFYSSEYAIQQAVLNVTNRLVSGAWETASLSELYTYMGLPITKAGDALGWSSYKNNIQVELDLTETVKCPFNGKPAIVFGFSTPPVTGFKGYE